MKYKAYFSDDMTYVKKTMNNMAKAASFRTFRKWDIRGDLDDIELACDRDTEDANYWDIIFANITSSASWGDMSCYERTVTYWNYIVFFPSYKYLEAVSTAFTERYPKVRTAIQKPGMTAADREAFLRFFADDRGVLRVGFCVLGGSFSEGIDLPGNRLIGTVIVGTGIPGLSAERNIIREYYDVKSGCGYDYAYTFPGMNSVLQAAGRVIRQDSDRGVQYS